jgi:hypothetical protein
MIRASIVNLSNAETKEINKRGWYQFMAASLPIPKESRHQDVYCSPSRRLADLKAISRNLGRQPCSPDRNEHVWRSSAQNSAMALQQQYLMLHF